VILSLRKYKDQLYILILFLLSVLIVYNFDSITQLIFQLILLIFYWKSKRDYLWFALIFIIESNPGALFYAIDRPFALIWLPSTGYLFFWMVLLATAIIKHRAYRLKKDFIFRNNVLGLFIYFCLLILVYGIGNFPYILRHIFPWTLFFILPNILSKTSDYAKFFKLLFLFVFIVLAGQLYHIFSGVSFATVIGGISNPNLTTSSIYESNEALRPADGLYINYFSLLGSGFFLLFNKKVFNTGYLKLVLGLSFFGIFLSATRAWTISAFFLLLVLIFLYSSNPFKQIGLAILPILVILLLVFQIPFLKKQVTLAGKRLSTVQKMAEGDISAGGTSIRFDVRAPRVMEGFRQNPLIGLGFGKQGFKYRDGHVGFHNLLLETGVIGFSLFLFLWLRFLFLMLSINKIIDKSNSYKNTALYLSAFLIGILLINTSVQWFGYLFTFPRAVIVIGTLFFANNIFHSALKEKKINEDINI